MLVGMGTVFSFLTILVMAMSAMSAIAVKFVATSIDENVSPEEVAAITAAIAEHRKK